MTTAAVPFASLAPPAFFRVQSQDGQLSKMVYRKLNTYGTVVCCHPTDGGEDGPRFTWINEYAQTVVPVDAAV